LFSKIIILIPLWDYINKRRGALSLLPFLSNIVDKPMDTMIVLTPSILLPQTKGGVASLNLGQKVYSTGST
jgi:hypothetical protein